jgi:hypothetical protein
MNGNRTQAVAFHNRAVEGVEKDPQLAYKLLVSACDVDPSFAGGFYALGNSNSDLKLLNSAIACFRRTLELPEGAEGGDRTPELTVKALVNIGHRLYHTGRLKEAEELTREALRKDPRSAEGLVNLSMIESVKGNDKEAVRLARRAYEVSRHHLMQLGLAFALLFDGQYAEGLRHFEARIPYKLPELSKYPWPRWEGQTGGTIYIMSEQGMGDGLSFLRFVPAAAARVGKVVLAVQREIARMCRDVLPANVDVLPIPHPLPAADWWCPIVSLPVALGLTDEEIRTAPGLAFPRYQMPAPWLVEDRFNIGIAWSGSKMNDIDKWRSIELDHFLELYRVPGVQLYSLQAGDASQDVHRIGGVGLIKDLSPVIMDAADTAAIINRMDLIVSIESFVGHLCGAINKECWIPLGYNGGDYRCKRSGDRPIWYDETRLFRQKDGEDWRPVFDRIVTALKARVLKGRIAA